MSGRLARLPLRTQLIVLLLVVVAAVVALTGLAGTAALRSYLLDRIDRQLVSGLQAEVDGPAQRGPGGPGRRGPGARRDLAVTTLEYDASGALLPRSAVLLRLAGGPDVRDASDLPSGPFDVEGTDGDRWRALARRDGDGRTVLVAAPRGGVDATASKLLVINVAVGLAALAGAGLLASWAVRRSLRPLVVVEETAEAIAAGDLSRRVPAGDPATEVGSLAASFNAMVDRFQSAYAAQQESEADARASEERMRRFVGDASHELRTPLTSIRGFAELFRQGAAEEPEQLARVMRRIEDEAARMGLLVEDLLLLARLDQQRPLRTEPVDLLAVAADAVHDAAALHADHHVVRLLPPTGQRPPVVLGDDARLRQVVGNLVANAVAHTPDGTEVDVLLGVTDGAVLLEVRDTGEGMPPEVAARVLERFYRADSSRTRASERGGGSGLGLSIVASLVAAHGGTVEVDSAVGRGTTVRVRLPAA